MTTETQEALNLDDLNQSELVELCKWMGIQEASRGWPRWFLYKVLESFEVPDIPNPLQDKREKLSRFLKMHWDRIRLQALKKACPNCFECKDVQIYACFERNKKSMGL